MEACTPHITLSGKGKAMRVCCPHCHQTIDVTDDISFKQVLCSACGSNFSLVPEETLSYHEAGSKTLGHFELLEQIGAGTFGNVWKARDKTLDRTVAIKVPRKGQLSAAETEQFFREARAVAQLKHPTIVVVHEVGREGDTVYIASDFVRGLTLADALTGQRFTLRQAAELCTQVADGLEHAHRAGVVHRDLKPSNIMLDHEGRPCILDFGLAKREAGEVTVTLDGQVLGTPAYMSPEQAAGESHKVDGRSDVYSLGVVLYELLTGAIPFRGNRAMLIHQVLHDEPQPPRKLNHHVPRDLETICLRAMAKERARRYQGAADMAEDLRRFLRGEPIRARPVRWMERLRRWCGRNRWLASTGGLAAFALSATIVVSISFALFQSRVAARLREEREQTRLALHEAQEQRTAAMRMSSGLMFDRGITLCDQGETARGMLWMARSIETAPPGCEDFEWLVRASLGQCKREIRELRAILENGSPVRQVMVSDDGRRILALGADNVARLWDAATAKSLGDPLRHGAVVEAVAVSPDGKTVATAGRDGAARLWDGATGRPLGMPLRHQDQVVCLSFSPDGKTLLTGSLDKTARLWDVTTGHPAGEPIGHPGAVLAVAFGPKGGLFLTGCGDGSARLWDAATQKPLGRPMQHPAAVRAVSFSADGSAVLVVNPDQRTARVWDAATSEPASPVLSYGGPLRTAILSPNGRQVLMLGWISYATLWTRDASAPESGPRSDAAWRATNLSHVGLALFGAFSPNGKLIATASSESLVRFWDAATGAPSGPPVEHYLIHSVAFAPDGARLLTGGEDGSVHAWAADAGRSLGEVSPEQKGIWEVAFSPDGRTAVVACEDGTARLWDTKTGRPVGKVLQHRGPVRGVAFSPDGRSVLTGSFDGSAQLWTLSGERLGGPFEHNTEVLSVAFNPKGGTLATGCNDGKARVWNAETHKLVLGPLAHPGAISRLCFSPDGGLLATTSMDSAYVWNISTGKPAHPPLKHLNGVWAVAFSPDGRRLLTGSEDHSAYLWDLADGCAVAATFQHGSPVKAVAFAPDGRTILTGCADGTAQLWDTKTAKRIGPVLRYANWTETVAFAPDGRTAITAGGRGNVARLWQLPSPVVGGPDALRLWAEVVTGMELDSDGILRRLDGQEWLRRKRALGTDGQQTTGGGRASAIGAAAR